MSMHLWQSWWWYWACICEYVDIGFLSFSTGFMGKWVVAVLLLTLQTICLFPPLLVFVGFNFFHLCLSIVFLYFVLLFVSPPFGICRIHLAPHSVNHSNTSSAITFVFKHFSAPFPFSHSQIYWLLWMYPSLQASYMFNFKQHLAPS